MGGDLTVEPIQLRGIASAVSSRVSALRINLNLVAQKNGEIAGSWLGDDANAYTNTVAEQKDQITKVLDSLDSLSATMTSIANAYEETQNEIAAAAGGGK